MTDMASANSLLNEENFLCTICLEVFNKPVTTACGHNFCSDCITQHWNTNNNVLTCPVCNEKFYSRPTLRVNTVLAHLAENVKTTTEAKSRDSPDQTESENVLCGICTGVKLPALKSCLVCFVSYCEKHLEPHQTIQYLKNHKLIRPVENLETRVCLKHGKPLDLFCKVDHKFLCESCKDDHKTHKIVSPEEEVQAKKELLGKEKTDTDQMILKRQQKIQEFQRSLEMCGNNAGKALSYNMSVMTAMADSILRSQKELTKVIVAKQKKVERETEGLIKELQGEIAQLEQNNLQLDQVSLVNDEFTFLEKFHTLTVTPPQVRDWSEVTLDFEQFDIQGALTKLQTTVMREIRILCDPNLKQMQQHAVDVTLDPDTAHPCLNISEDRKEVTHGDRKRVLPNTPRRFDHVPNVLGKECFSAGKFYFEVCVKGKTNWDLGIVAESINRKGDTRLSPMNGYWTIWLRKGNELTANAGPAINLHIRELPQQVGIFVDYEAGQVSFYDAEARALIFSFTGCNFTEKLFPYFSPCSNDGSRNAAPLVITPIKCSD
ncbi:uncharacterized protein V6R79_015628 [Siganus canaliculatus]